MKKKILITDPLPDFVLKKLREKGEVTYAGGGLGNPSFRRAIEDAEILIVRSATKIDRVLLRRAKKLKVVITATHGFEHVDLAELEKRKIKFHRTPAAAIGVTEFVFCMMLSLLRNIPAADNSVRYGKWDRERFTGRELFGKTLGVVGLGPIGQDVCRMAKHFGMQIVACDPNSMVTGSELERLSIKLLPLVQVLQKADILTIHAHLNDKTKHMIGSREIEKMKPGSYLINTARGGLVDQEALCRALRSGHLAGAALDVYEREPIPKNDPITKLPNMILTPHIGIQTEEGMERIGKKVLEIIAKLV
jgi:D-3-phosphoglycerate dehydrogenase